MTAATLTTVSVFLPIVFVRGVAGQLFYDLCKQSQDNDKLRRPLTRKEWKFHFHAWWHNASRRLPSKGVIVPARLVEYFAKLEQ